MTEIQFYLGMGVGITIGVVWTLLLNIKVRIINLEKRFNRSEKHD